ncbi:putative FATTY-ACID-CoA LIGASE FADD9 domain protein [Mycobacterium kansasii 662]|uniref:Putative FATTY-ACID-CoA LIGASE FADD9 domain protein n=1 Tax=Mycobacterium kansasii 662 TaxID=1299326 RepID=X7XP51_MYCKA|nr:putative FATTY-ACID-CoA LIGASE FADD9 domain protein [Mycobacterium kansasii 662]
MILADTTWAGQLNVPDMFTRMMLSLVATGIAPGSFYELDADGNRQRAHYDGLPVEFIAEAIATLGARDGKGFQTYHVMNPYDDGIGMDRFVDWLVDAGCAIHRIDDYGDWLATIRDRAARPARKAASRVTTAVAAQLPEAAAAAARVDGSDRPVPGGRARTRKWARTRTSAHLAADHREVPQ